MNYAISIRQPWAGLIVLGFKDIENRTWPTPPAMIGKNFLIHAGKQPDPNIIDRREHNPIVSAAFDLAVRCGISGHAFDLATEANPQAFNMGGIVGVAKIVTCLTDSGSCWASPERGTFHWLLGNRKALPFHPCKGSLGLFRIEYPYPLEVANA
ncbi:MAG: RNA-binding protein [Pseudodesulfovibrio sp.]|uniref:ASCH domain-containing protein n=1 Tax=Pseudodesulfovibrio sp. TaxID=2035812 RepID=UPI003D0E1632